MVLRWRRAKNIGIYGVFLFREREKSRKHRLFDAFWVFAKTAIFGGLQKSTNYKDNNDNDNRTKQLQQQQL